MFESGEILDSASALRLGLLHRLASDDVALHALAHDTAMALLSKGPHALAATKRWLQDLDGSIEPVRATTALQASLSTVGDAAGRELLRSVWNARRKG